MKSIFLFLFLAFTQILGAQNFTEKTGAPFDGVEFGSVSIADVDGDNAPDVLITGMNSSGSYISKLYINDGAGHFTEKVVGTPFEVVLQGSVAFADVDGDNAPDVLITGQNSYRDRISKLYINNESGNFTEMTGTPFDGVKFSSIAFADVDGDNDLDVLIMGLNSSAIEIAKLYTNDGTGNFTEMTGTPFEGVEKGSIAFADVDGDSDLDVIITGFDISKNEIAKLYINDGTGNFTERLGTPFEGVFRSSIAFADVDGDSDPDVIITGANRSRDGTAKLYLNDGEGNFSEVTGTPFDGVDVGSIAFADLDGDNDPDVIITGLNNSNVLIAKLYLNDGEGNFSEVTGTPFDGVLGSSIAFADVDGNTYPDLLITGQNNSSDRIAKLYINDGVTNSTEDFIPGFDIELKAYPNPTSSNRVNVRFESEKIGFTTLNLYDVNGHRLRQQKEFSGIGKQTLCMDIASLPPGSYYIQLDKGKRKGVARFVVQ